MSAVPPRVEILVVDDEPAVLRMLGEVLRHEGFAVRLAASGQEAVELYAQCPTSVSAVLLDMEMLGGLDGPQTLAALRAINSKLPCCFMSGSAAKLPYRELMGLGRVCLVAKPFTSLANLARLLGEAASW